MPQLGISKQCLTAEMIPVLPSGVGMTNLPCELVPFVIAATAVRKRIALGPAMEDEISTKITSPPTAEWSM